MIHALQHEYPIIDGVSYPPALPRYIQPKYGLEVAMTNIGDIPQV
jgi:hypothetical protein